MAGNTLGDDDQRRAVRNASALLLVLMLAPSLVATWADGPASPRTAGGVRDQVSWLECLD